MSSLTVVAYQETEPRLARCSGERRASIRPGKLRNSTPSALPVRMSRMMPRSRSYFHLWMRVGFLPGVGVCQAIRSSVVIRPSGADINVQDMGRIITLIPSLPRGQALAFPHQGFTGVGTGNKRTCACDFTPILAFPRRGGRDFEPAYGSLGIYLPFSARRGGRNTGLGGLTQGAVGAQVVENRRGLVGEVFAGSTSFCQKVEHVV